MLSLPPPKFILSAEGLPSGLKLTCLPFRPPQPLLPTTMLSSWTGRLLCRLRTHLWPSVEILLQSMLSPTLMGFLQTFLSAVESVHTGRQANSDSHHEVFKNLILNYILLARCLGVLAFTNVPIQLLFRKEQTLLDLSS